jgi:hypothetical protein
MFWNRTFFNWGNTGAKVGTKDAERGEKPPAWQCGQIKLEIAFETGGSKQ